MKNFLQESAVQIRGWHILLCLSFLNAYGLAPDIQRPSRRSGRISSLGAVSAKEEILVSSFFTLRLRGGSPDLLNQLSADLMNATKISEKQLASVARAVKRDLASQNQSSVEHERLQSFRAGRMVIDGTTLRPLPDKGLLLFEASEDDGMVHMLWTERSSFAADHSAPLDLILVPGLPKPYLPPDAAARKDAHFFQAAVDCHRDPPAHGDGRRRDHRAGRALGRPRHHRRARLRPRLLLQRGALPLLDAGPRSTPPPPPPSC
jgi:hypothetical protein